MQQRQLRLGDILDDYCPRERRLTNHAVVAMVGDDVKQTRCTTCDAEHEYKHARVPRQRRKTEPAALYAQAAAGAPKKVVLAAVPPNEPDDDIDAPEPEPAPEPESEPVPDAPAPVQVALADSDEPIVDDDEAVGEPSGEEGPVHRPLIRAQLPRVDGQPPQERRAPDFTIRQPAGRQNRFRPRHQRGGAGQGFAGGGNRAGGNMSGNSRGGGPRPQGGRPPLMSARPAKRHGPGRKGSK